jgi:copper chaperone CopZ
MKFLWGIVIVLVVMVCGCRHQDKRVATLSIPEMKNQACAAICVNALATRPGVDAKTIQVDYATRSITLRYDSMQLAMKNLEFAVSDAGFSANGIPANQAAAAKLPADCR